MKRIKCDRCGLIRTDFSALRSDGDSINLCLDCDHLANPPDIAADLPKHTPGPWIAQGNLIFGKELGSKVCKLFTQHIPGEKSGFAEEGANASLIAAAPELYNALERLVNAVHGPLDEVEPSLDEAYRALAVARGE